MSRACSASSPFLGAFLLMLGLCNLCAVSSTRPTGWHDDSRCYQKSNRATGLAKWSGCGLGSQCQSNEVELDSEGGGIGCGFTNHELCCELSATSPPTRSPTRATSPPTRSPTRASTPAPVRNTDWHDDSRCYQKSNRATGLAKWSGCGMGSQCQSNEVELDSEGGGFSCGYTNHELCCQLYATSPPTRSPIPAMSPPMRSPLPASTPAPVRNTDWHDDSRCYQKSNRATGKAKWSGCGLGSQCQSNEVELDSEGGGIGCGFTNHELCCQLYATSPPIRVPSSTSTPTWSCTFRPSAYQACSVSCGTGKRTRSLDCLCGGNVVANAECEASKAFKPQTEELCSQPACAEAGAPPTRSCTFRPSAYQACSVSCGTGKRTRSLDCLCDGNVVANAECEASKAFRPQTEEPCSQPACAVTAPLRAGTAQGEQTAASRAPSCTFRPSAYQACSVSCGTGKRTRSLDCLCDGNIVANAECEANNAFKPPAEEPCSKAACASDPILAMQAVSSPGRASAVSPAGKLTLGIITTLLPTLALTIGQ